MRIVKILAIVVVVVYVGLVVAFESLIGHYQPQDPNTMVITTKDEAGNSNTRVVSRLETDGKLYVAANHWPRRWYREVLADPHVAVAWGGSTQPYVAVPVTGAEFDRVNTEHALPAMVRVMTGFPPRKIVRLDPVAPPVDTPAAPPPDAPIEPQAAEPAPPA